MPILSEYLSDLRTIRNIGAGVAETTYYGPLANLFNSVGKTLKPKVLCLLHVQNTGAGIPDAGFFTATQIQRASGQATPGQRPARGVLKAKPFPANLDQLATTPQVLSYLSHYNQVLITNLRQFRLLTLVDGVPHMVEHYSPAENVDDLFLPATGPNPNLPDSTPSPPTSSSPPSKP